MTRDVGGVLLQPGFGPATAALQGYLTPAATDAVPDVTAQWGPADLTGPTRTVARRLEVAVAGPPTLLWRRAAGLPVDLRATWSDERLDLHACLAPDRREQLLRRLRPQRLPQQLLYLLGIYPSAWVARRRDGAALLHASAVELEGRGLLVAGPGGVGKSSLAAAALALGGRLVSDNLVLATAQRVRGWREPVRLAGGADDPASGLTDVGGNGWHGRRDHLLAADRWVPSVRPALVLLPQLADRAAVHPEEDAVPWAERLLALGALAGELTRWRAFTAALDSLDARPVADPRDTLTTLLSGVPLRRVDLSRTADPAALRRLVHDLVCDLPTGETAR
jgi:hypothetical protein